MVGTPRCGVPDRVQRSELLQPRYRVKGPRCAAERGADIAARCPYLVALAFQPAGSGDWPCLDLVDKRWVIV